MPTIRRSALVEHSTARMFALVNDVAAYPRRFDWCDDVQVLESSDTQMVARLDLGLGALRTWFTTQNTLSPPHHIDLKLIDGPFRSLTGRWEFHALDESACKVTLMLSFEPKVKLLAPAMALGFQSLADRMVDDFIRVADADQDSPDIADLAKDDPAKDDRARTDPGADRSGEDGGREGP